MHNPILEYFEFETILKKLEHRYATARISMFRKVINRAV